MKKLALIESIYNILDSGIYMEMARHAKKTRVEMGPKAFMKHLLFGRGYNELIPPQLTQKLKARKTTPLIVDLREKEKFKKGHIKGAVLHPFDDFLREIIVDEGYREFQNRAVVLLCDTGQKSRVAASILSDEGFLKVSSLKRGMRRWNRWEALLFRCRRKQNSPFHICSGFF